MLHKFNDLTIGQKLNIGFGILVLLLLLIVSLIFAAGQAATESINLTVDVRVPAALASTRAQSNLLKMRAAVRGYLAVGDLKNIDDYNRAKEQFQDNLAQLKMLSADWSDAEDVERLDELISAFAAWLPLPDRVFALHDNPLMNQPALQLVAAEIQPLSMRLLADIEQLIAIQSKRPSSPENRKLLATMIDLQSSLQAMSTNLRAYAGTGDLVYKFGYAEQVVANGRRFGELDATQASLTGEQWLYYIQYLHRRERFLALPDQLFAAVEGPKSHQDLYLFQQEMEPQAERMLQLLEALTAGQQLRLQQELTDGAQRLAGVQYQTLLGGLLALLLGVAMAYFFRESIASPIRRLNSAAQRFGAGNLKVQAQVEHSDEIGRLATTFNTMAGRLHTMIDELAHARDVAETASRAKSDFLARMSHELRTPLNGILGYGQILARNPALDERQRHALAVIHANGEHLLTLITDILDFSKIEARKLELSPTKVLLLQFFNGIVDAFYVRAQEKPAVQFRVTEVADLPPFIYADEQRLRQILVNLLDNAFKFTDQGEICFTVKVIAQTDVVGVAAEIVRPDIVKPDITKEETVKEESAKDAKAATDPPIGSSPTVDEVEEWLEFSVADSGTGMAAAELATVFLPFEQAGDRCRRVQGTGLGLAISHELAQAMGGTLTASSVLGVGSRFVLQLQLRTQPASKSSTVGVNKHVDRYSAIAEKHNTFEQNHAVGKDNPVAVYPQLRQMPSLLPSPPAAELAVLLDMAYKGELPRLRRRVIDLGVSDSSYQPFVESMLALIETYDEEQLLSLLEQLQ